MMKFFSLDTVAKAYNSNSNTTTNKFWGLLGILSAVDSTVSPSISYDFKSDKVSNILDSIFILKDNITASSRGQSRSIMLSKEWTDYVVNVLTPGTPNIYSVLVWYFRHVSFDDTISNAELIIKFLDAVHISMDDAKKIFSFENITIEYSESKYSEASLKTGLNLNGDNITAEKATVVAAPGDFTRGPFLQPLYASQDIMKCLILSTFNLNQYYMDDIAAVAEDLRECVFGPIECGVGKPGMPGFLEGVIVTTKEYEDNLESLAKYFKATEKNLYVEDCCIGIDPVQADILMSIPKHEKDANKEITWSYGERSFCLYRELREKTFRNFINAYNKAYAGVFEINVVKNESGALRYSLYKIHGCSFKTMQKIYFGAPGSGKSHAVNKLVKEQNGIEFRTTFHPDCDYSTFVGTYKPKKSPSGIDYSFIPQVFTNAYVTSWKNPTKQVFLIIEEINRGNCAQIFGDLFQLLDRKNGWSEYSITADTDLAEYLTTELAKIQGNEVDGRAGIDGGMIRLRPNLHILATMNTSDQSLFPMDSAFKRRWDWEYIPIDAANKDSQFTIDIDGKLYDWSKFLVAVNEHIKDVSDSEDKQMGNFFIKENIKKEEFVSKVMFYLWSEVCKDEYRARSFFHYKDGNNDEFSFNQLFKHDGEKTVIDTDILHGFMKFLRVNE